MIVVPDGCWIARSTLVQKTEAVLVVHWSFGQPAAVPVALGAVAVSGPIVLPPGPKKSSRPFLILDAGTTLETVGAVKGTLFCPCASWPCGLGFLQKYVAPPFPLRTKA